MAFFLIRQVILAISASSIIFTNHFSVIGIASSFHFCPYSNLVTLSKVPWLPPPLFIHQFCKNITTIAYLSIMQNMENLTIVSEMSADNLQQHRRNFCVCVAQLETRFIDEMLGINLCILCPQLTLKNPCKIQIF